MELLRNNQIGTPIGNLCFVLPNLVHHHCLTAGTVFCSKLNFSDLHIHHCSFSLCISIKQITHEISSCKELLVVCHALFGKVGPNHFKQFLIREEGQHPLSIFWICNVEVPFLCPQHFDILFGESWQGILFSFQQSLLSSPVAVGPRMPPPPEHSHQHSEGRQNDYELSNLPGGPHLGLRQCVEVGCYIGHERDGINFTSVGINHL